MSHSEHSTTDVVKRFWRSLEERDGQVPADAAERPDEAPIQLRAAPAQEFEQPAEGSVGRRRFLQMMGASVAIPSLAACTRQPPEKIIPFVRAPEDVVPGRPLFYASATLLGGEGRGTADPGHPQRYR